MAVRIIKANILSTGAKYIAHQTNCTSNDVKGLAKEIFELCPYSNCYKQRDEFDTTTYSKPGTIQICGDGLEQRFIINMFAQYYPGKSTTMSNDSIEARKKYFFDCLMEISKIDDLGSIAFPEKIGCGLADGDWEWYFKKILAFEKYVERKAKVYIYRFEK